MRFLLSIAFLTAFAANAATTILTNSGTWNTSTAISNVPSGLVGWWRGEYKSLVSGNLTNTDISGNGNHGGMLGGINLTNSFISSPQGVGISTPLSTDYIQCGSGSTLDDLDLATGMTLVFWVRFPTASGAQYLWCKGTGAGFWQLLGSIGTYPYGLSFTKDCATTDFTENYVAQFYTNSWTHIALAWDGGVVSNSTALWVNGRRVYSTSATAGVGAKASDAALNLTQFGVPGSDNFNGDMADRRIYNRVLTTAEVCEIFNSGRTISHPPDDLVNYTATNFLDFDAVLGDVSTTVLTNITRGAAMGAWSLTGSATHWQIVTLNTLTNRSSVTVAGVNYSSQSNALACSLDSSSDSQFLGNFPASTPKASLQFYFMTQLPQNPGSGNTFDYLTMGSVANNGVGQLVEGPAQWNRVHTIMDGTTYTGGKVITYPNVWYFCSMNWDTNAGLFHYRIAATDDYPLPELRNQIIYYGTSPIRAGSNASYMILIHGPHGQARAGRTNFYKMISWQYVNATNHPLYAMRNWDLQRTCDDWPISTERRQIISYSISPLPSNTNASYCAITDNTHGMFGLGTNYWAGWAAMPGLASAYIPGLKMRTNYLTGGVQ